ncbi:UDP-N-acetylmuramate--L-alanine ligase [Alkalinema sp. FACHB-956]|uniref:UDP-N-acetylmuramate--L-alanine ligase n=1 Tax=Alkalinema sp. FACHB-956 TaxID=2692768 RepID=UPI001686CC5E|nr:UDP-N-acetylmuramate--L-alanine ligase [Alkalinema sp. FACHB-956]MBD2326379.1 UDP-N-acetylmuramate--L-alanine ligase [Alkalinema sp. FACHB-956]
MLNSIDFSGRPFHFIGIGGIGMSAIAHILVHRKLPVSGSDLRLTHITERLRAEGAHIFLEQSAANLEFFRSRQPAAVGGVTGIAEETGADAMPPKLLPQVVCSTAIHPENPEYQAARALGCPILHRSDVLAGLMQQYQGIAVAGTHGKTTTSSLLGYLLLETGMDPTIVVGGEVLAWDGNARAGKSDYLVAEADESDGSLVKFNAQIGIITNIELDHPDHYSDLEEVVETFQTFASHCKTLVGSIDCPTVLDRIQPTITYSLDPQKGATYSVQNVLYDADGTVAQVYERGEYLGDLKLKILGTHNLSNALAALAVGRFLGLDFAAIATALSTFEGARRRFELRGEANQIRFIDDYAHHPSEIQVTLAAARLQVSAAGAYRRLVAVFQPHRYSRMLTFLPEFSQSFVDADVVIISDIYSAGEANPGNMTGQHLADRIAENHAGTVHYQPSLPQISEFLNHNLQPGDLVIFLGAGNLNQIIPDAIAYQREQAEKISHI